MRCEFVAFEKIPRLKRTMTVMEKIDGTNAQIVIERCTEFGDRERGHDGGLSVWIGPDDARVGYLMRVGSRNRWITPESDNYGFAQWAHEHAEELVSGLGEGSHYGEWWGSGIQRRYGLTEKRFSLFNTGRWIKDGVSVAPACCSVVPVLYEGPFDTAVVDAWVSTLRETGSRAVPGFMDPEGVVVYLTASRGLFKVTCKDDEKRKSEA